MELKKIVVAGASGYLGQYVVKELRRQGYYVRALVRNKNRFLQKGNYADDIFECEVTIPSSLKGCCAGMDAVISTVGITRQKDGLTYWDVDFQANQNVLNSALSEQIKKCVYVSVLNGAQLKHLDICAAKEAFVKSLQNSGLKHTVIRPGGFFSDLEELLTMARNGRVFLFADGQYKGNPIHGADLAEVVVDSLSSNTKEIEVGGPEVLTHEEMAQIAFDALNKKSAISYIPDGIRRFVLKAGKCVLPKRIFGPMQFFMEVMAMDMVAKSYGRRTLYEHFKSKVKMV